MLHNEVGIKHWKSCNKLQKDVEKLKDEHRDNLLMICHDNEAFIARSRPLYVLLKVAKRW